MFFCFGYWNLYFLKNFRMCFWGLWYIIWFLDKRIMLLKSLNVFGVGCNSDMKMVDFIIWYNWCKYFMIWYVVELLSFVEILFMNSVFVGFIIILFVLKSLKLWVIIRVVWVFVILFVCLILFNIGLILIIDFK